MNESELDSPSISRWRIKDFIIKLIGSHAPSAFALLATSHDRTRVNVRAQGNIVDISYSSRVIRIRKGNFVYIPQIVDNFEYYYSSVDSVTCRIHEQTVRLVDFSVPGFHYVHEFPDFPLLCPGLIEPFKTTQQYLDFARLKPGQVVIDLGAYSGLTSIAFAREVGPKGRVIAVEPDPLTLAACKVNLARAGHSNVTLVDKAVAPSAGRIRFSSEGALGSAYASLVGAHRGTVVEVDGITLEGLIEQHQLERLDFIKMDIEGAEASVLPECAELIKRYRPKILIEPHVVGGMSTAPALRAFLEGLDYRCEFIDQYETRTLALLAASP